ncbi:MAG: PhoH family protein [Deltaproteobacteria bacterium]|nr:PhoH family protein [Candidatus Anaeroferrophillus wilburensis]MBN2889874.1 PhoH family protein [Deltaproteobacteria bacterium]
MEKIEFDNTAALRIILGDRDEHIRLLEEKSGLKIQCRGNTVMIDGDQIRLELVAGLLRELYQLVLSGYPLYETDIDYAYRIKAGDAGARLRDIFLDKVYISHKGSKRQPIAPKTVGQKRYIDAIRNHDIVFGIGPAGTGKTYLAMAMAIAALTSKAVDRIILTRPAVEAGERLGFLPGDLQEKVNPYLRPLYDALHDMLDFSRSSMLLDKGIIEVAPLAFMRGRTLNNAFVIFDEAQNSSAEQMKMFLTRLGFGSQAVVTGDITQTDLPENKESGLVKVQGILQGVEGISFCYLSQADVVRHPLVQKIIAAYERHS